MEFKLQSQQAPQQAPIIHTPWLAVARERLAHTWISETGHPRLNSHQPKSWAMELKDACNLVKGHLSLPCSLHKQADQIGAFLLSNSFDGNPELFLKIYLMLLGEFCAQLRDINKLMNLADEKPPRSLAVWNNCWAKHSLRVLVRHHPRFVFADDLGPDWAKYDRSIPTLLCESQDGTRTAPEIIDTEWMCTGDKCDLEFSNDGRPRVIVVPPLKDFLSETSAYFRSFIDRVLANPCVIQIFESPHHTVWRPVIDTKAQKLLVPAGKA